MNTQDSKDRFYIASSDKPGEEEEELSLETLQTCWSKFTSRLEGAESIWIEGLSSYLDDLANLRIGYVQEWLDINMARFKTDQPEFDSIHRSFETMVVGLKGSIQICKLQCADCHLSCVRARHHSGSHSCRTDHGCPKNCHFAAEHDDRSEPCGLPYVYIVILLFFALMRPYQSRAFWDTYVRLFGVTLSHAYSSIIDVIYPNISVVKHAGFLDG